MIGKAIIPITNKSGTNGKISAFRKAFPVWVLAHASKVAAALSAV
ncbi:hypothetical protein [Coprobacter fastidiosus]